MPRLFVLFAVLLFAFAAQAKPLEIRAIPKEKVREFVLGRLRTPLMKELAQKPGSLVSDVLDKIERAPLFVFEPTEHPASRLNFTSYYRLLALRDHAYENPLIGDLYLMHELHHAATMPYAAPESFEEWSERLILNERETSVTFDAMIFALEPEVRAQFPVKEIWVDRFISEKAALKPGVTNAWLLENAPEEFRARLIQEHARFAETPYSSLDAVERRYWIYARSNEVWAQIYWPYAYEIELEMKQFYERASRHPEAAAKRHLAWLRAATEGGLVLKAPALQFQGFYKSLSELHLNPDLPDYCARCTDAVKRLDDLVEQKKVERTPALPGLRELLGYGISNTVYSVPFPETKEVTQKKWDTFEYGDLYGEPYTKKQDIEHREFLDAFKAWASPVVEGLEGYGYSYPANGSSEALKDTLSRIKAQNAKARIHVFHGEYEGIAAYAQALELEVVKHVRDAARFYDTVSSLQAGDYFYLSEPSGIDGNLWKDYERFMKLTQMTEAKILVDLAYVGTVAKEYKIRVDYPHLDSVFFSLSKAFGAYYQRIGGVFSRQANPMLFGNMWFKNIASLRVGTELLKTNGVYDLPRRYRWAQIAVVQEASKSLGVELTPSDVAMLASRRVLKEEAKGTLGMLYRGDEKSGVIRACVTPGISVLIDKIHACQKNLEQLPPETLIKP